MLNYNIKSTVTLKECYQIQCNISAVPWWYEA